MGSEEDIIRRLRRTPFDSVRKDINKSKPIMPHQYAALLEKHGWTELDYIAAFNKYVELRSTK